MKRLLFFIIAIAFILTLSYTAPQCRRTTPEEDVMNRAEKLLSEKPDSALALMRSLGNYNTDDEQLMGRYALLKTWVEYQNYVDVTDDSLIKKATLAMRHDGDTYRNMVANFLHAHTLYGSEDYYKAVMHILLANRIAEHLKDTLWMAKCYGLTSRIFYDGYVSADTTQHYTRLSAYYFSHTPFKLNELYAKLDLALTYIDDHKDADAARLLDSIIAVSRRQAPDSSFVAQCLAARMSASTNLRQFAKALDCYEELKRNRADLYSQDFTAAARASIGLGQLGKGKMLIDSAYRYATSMNDTFFLINAEIDYLKDMGDFRRATELSELQEGIYERRLAEATRNPVRKALRDNSDREARISKKKVSQLKVIIWCGIGAVVLLAVIVVLGIKLFAQSKNRKIEAQLNELLSLSNSIKEHQLKEQRLSSELEQSHSQSQSLQDRAGRLLNARIETINQFCDSFFNIENPESSSEEIIENIRHEVLTLRDKDNLKTLIDMIDEEHDNIVTRLRRSIPSLSDDDIALAALSYGHFSARTICLLLNLKLKGYYTKRSRLRQKIKDSESPDSADFLEGLA